MRSAPQSWTTMMAEVVATILVSKARSYIVRVASTGSLLADQSSRP
jgi:hypothetical protein